MEQQKFKVGDRVRANKPMGPDNLTNLFGTIVKKSVDDKCFTVEFDYPIPDWGYGVCGRLRKDCKYDEIEPIHKAQKKRGRPVGSKNKKKVELEPEKWEGDKIKDKVKEHIPELNSNSFRTYKEVPESGHLIELNEEILKTLYNINGLLEKLVDIQTNEKQFDIVEWFKDMLAKD